MRRPLIDPSAFALRAIGAARLPDGIAFLSPMRKAYSGEPIFQREHLMRRCVPLRETETAQTPYNSRNLKQLGFCAPLAEKEE